MSTDGTWKLNMQTPFGERKATLALDSSAGSLTGQLTNEEGNSTSIYDGTLEQNKATWKADIKSPMPLTLAFSAAVDGDVMTGTVSAGAIGTWNFSGSR